MKQAKVLSLAVFALMLGACGSSAPETRDTVAPADSLEANTAPTPVATAGGEAGPCELSGVRFAFDSSDLDAAARSQLDSNVRCIQARNLARVRVTGTTDPRGTEEYNLALGDRRAQATATYLGSLGVESGKIESHSTGEEFAAGSDEGGWANDRRADVSPAQ